MSEPQNDEKLLTATESTPLVQLPDEVNMMKPPPGSMAPLVNDGLHGLWVADYPDVRTTYKNMGVHIVKPGEGLVPDESIFAVSEEGFLSNGGDALVGVIKQSAYVKEMQRLHDEVKKDMKDVVIFTDASMTQKLSA